MPLGGTDQRYDLPHEEQDKIRRRIELRNRLKEEGIRRRYSPFLGLKNEAFQDPAVNRYMDFRKRGRLPNTPFKPSLFYGMVAFTVIPITLLVFAVEWERKDWKEGCESGAIPYEKRPFKAFG